MSGLQAPLLPSLAPSSADDSSSLELARTVPSRQEETPSRVVREILATPAEEGQIEKFLQNRTLKRLPLAAEGSCQYYTRNALKALAPIVSMWGNVYYFPVNMKAAKGNKILGGFLCGGSSVAVVALNSWAQASLVDSYLKRKTPEETAMEQSGLSGCSQAAVDVSAFALGLLAQSSIAYVASINNGGKILPAAVLLLSDGPLPIYSCKLSIEKLLTSRKSVFEQELNTARELLQERLSANRNRFLMLDREDQVRFVDEARALEGVEEGRDDTKSTWSLLRKLTEHDVEEAEESCLYSATKKGVFGAGVGLALSHQYLFAQLGYEASSRLTGSDVAGYVGGALVGGANLYLNGVSVANTAVDLFEGAVSVCRGEYVPSISEQLRPMATVMIKIIGLACSILSYGGSLGMAEDAFVEKWLQDTFGITVSISFALFTLSAFLALSSEALDYSIKSGSDREETKLMEFDEAWRALSFMLSIAPEREIALFLLKTPEDILSKICSDPVKMKAIARSYVEGITTKDDRDFQALLKELREGDAMHSRAHEPLPLLENAP